MSMTTMRMGRVTAMIGVTAVLFCLAGAGCRPEPAAQPLATPAPAVAEEALALRSFDVPEQSQPQIVALLRTLLQHGDETPVGRADAAPGNRVVVLAPERVLTGIDTLMADLARTHVEIPPMATYVVDHWLVLGAPAAATAVSGQLASLQPALDAIVSTQGPMTFALLEHLRIRSMDHEQAEISGVYGGVRQSLTREHQQLLAELDVRAAGAEWRTRLSVEPGQFVVLAQVGFDYDLPRDPFAIAPAAPTLAIPGLSPLPAPAGAEGTGESAPAGPWLPPAGTNLYHVFWVQVDDSVGTP